MLKQGEVKEIKELIKQGLSLKLMSFELDIPIEQLKEYKRELENEDIKKVRTRSAKSIIDEENKREYEKIEKIKQRYYKLYFKSDRKEPIVQKELSQEEMKKVKIAIINIKKLIQEINSCNSLKDQKSNINMISSEINNIKDLPLSIEQLEEVLEALDLVKIKYIDEKKHINYAKEAEVINLKISRNKRCIIKKIVQNVDNCQEQTEDIEELKKLNKKLTMQMQKEDYIAVSTVKMRIVNKITMIEQKEASDRIRNNIPYNIEQIIIDLAKGTLDIKEANKIIEEEASYQIQNNTSKFALTKEQKEKQILNQIKIILSEDEKKYDIKNPQTTIIQMQEIYKGDINSAITAVVKNLIKRKNFEKAKDLCDEFSKKSEKNPIISILKKEIRSAEIGDLVLKVINMKGSIEEQKVYFEQVEKGIKKEKINLKSIPLGKSQDGLSKITLEDIWVDEDIKERR